MWPESVRTYGKMRHDSKLAAVLRAYFLPIIRATWAVDPEGISRSEAVDLVANDLGLPILGEIHRPADAAIPGFKWEEHVRLALLDQCYGFMPFERWYEVRDGRTHLAGVQERLPYTITGIDLDEHSGAINWVEQSTQTEPIQAGRLLWYVNQREGANWAGQSILRDSYTPWVYKHEVMRVHATAIRRFGMGVPGVEAPPNATPAQVEQARQLAADMRVGDTTGYGMPSGFKFTLTGMTGSVPDAMAFLDWLNGEMSGSVLANIVEQGRTTYGSRALGETFLDLFLLSLQAVADHTGANATMGEPGMPGLAKSLVEYNWGEGEPVPKIVTTDVGDRHELTAIAVSQLMSTGALTWDPALEAFVREAWGLPERTEPAQVPPPPPSPGDGPGLGVGTGLPKEPTANPPAPAAAARRASPRGVVAYTARARRRGLWPFRAAPPRGLRRNLSKAEIAAGFDAVQVQSDWEQALAMIKADFGSVITGWHNQLMDQVQAAADKGRLDRLAGMSVDPGEGPDLLFAAMADLAGKARDRVIREAFRQAVDIPAGSVKISDKRLRRVAEARTGVLGQFHATQAASKALQVVAKAGDGDVSDLLVEQAATKVGGFLDSLSDRSLIDQLGAALSMAQNTGRIAALASVPSETPARFLASEVLDQNTCDPCQGEDGAEFGSLEEAQAAYPNGGFDECEGFLRCRGTVIAVFGDGGF